MKKPKLLDWIKERTGSFHPELDPRAHGHATWKEVYEEMRADERLAKLRDETGKEPESTNEKAIKRASASWER